MSLNLKSAFISGIFFTLLSRFVGNMSQVLIFIVLARLLTPEEFGLFAIVAVVVNIIVMLVTAGVSTLNIQLKSRTKSTYGDIFWIAQGLCLFFMIGLIFFTPVIALVLGQGLEFQKLLLMFGFTLFLSVANTVQISEATRLFEYRRVFKFTAIPSGFAGILACIGALYGCGVYSLIINIVLARLFSCICFQLGGIGVPRLSWDFHLIRKVFRFSASLILINLLEELSRGLLVLIAGTQSAASAGFLNVGRQIPMFASSIINATIVSVAFPIFSRLSEAEQDLNRAFCQTLFSLSLLLTPGIIMLVQHSEQIVIFVLGDQWAPSADFLKTFTVVYLTGFFPVLFTQVFNARGKPGEALNFNLLVRGGVLISIGMTYYLFYDLNLVVTVYLISHILSLLISSLWLVRRGIYKVQYLREDFFLITGAICVFVIASVSLKYALYAVDLYSYSNSPMITIAASFLYFFYVIKNKHPTIQELKTMNFKFRNKD